MELYGQLASTYYSYSTSSTIDSGPAAAFAIFLTIISLVIAVFMVVSLWRLFAKAGKPGWASIVPFYNYIVMLEIAGKPIWWFAMFFVPFADIVFAIMTLFAFVKAYGRSDGFAVLSIFFPFVTYPMMAFSASTQYVGVATQQYGAQVTPMQQPPAYEAQPQQGQPLPPQMQAQQQPQPPTDINNPQQ